MLITVSSRCELRVVADGSLVVGRPFEAGESFRVAFSDAVELSGDNAGVVQYSRAPSGSSDSVGKMLGAWCAGSVKNCCVDTNHGAFGFHGRQLARFRRAA